MRKVLLVSSPFGMGHRGVARAVARRLSQREGVFVEELALEERLSGAALFAAATEGRMELEPDVVAWEDAHLVAAFDPVAALVAREAGAGRRLAGVVCELDPPSDWFGAPLRALLVADEEAAERAVAQGMAEERLFVVGLPTCEAFAEPPLDREAARRLLGLDPSGQVLLVAGAGMRPAEIREILGRIGPECRKATLLVDVGLDPEAFSVLSGATGAVILGKRPDVAACWAAAQVVVGRARPDVVSRALATGLPVILLPPGSPTEERTARGVEARGLGWAGESLEGLGGFAQMVLDAGGPPTERVSGWRRPGVADRIAGVLDRLAAT